MTPAAAPLAPKSPTSAATSILLLFSLSLFALPALTVTASYCPNLHRSFLLLAAFVLASLLLVVAARAAMVTWITLLVLLTFAGNRRRVLVQHGRQITADVVVNLFRSAA